MKNSINGLDVVTFHPSHIEVAYLTEHEETNFERIPDAYKKVSDLASRSMQAVTILENGKILMMCGFVMLWKGVAEMWLLPSMYLVNAPISSAKTIKQFINSVFETMELHRMQAQVIDEEVHSRFMDFLGFTQDGIMPRYSDIKENYIMWSRT